MQVLARHHHRLTELLGGAHRSESPPGAGTTFTVRLLLAVAGCGYPFTAHGPRCGQGTARSMEDVATNRMLMEDRAAKLGWKPVQADGPGGGDAPATERTSACC